MTYPLNPDSFGKIPKLKPKAAALRPGLHLPEVDRLELRLADIPPSVNHMFANSHHGGRHKSKDYTTWLTTTGWKMKPQFVGRVPGNVVIDLTICRMAINADLDNRIKPSLDFLVTHGLIDDDRHVEEIHARWGGLSGCLIVIERGTDVGVRL